MNPQPDKSRFWQVLESDPTKGEVSPRWIVIGGSVVVLVVAFLAYNADYATPSSPTPRLYGQAKEKADIRRAFERLHPDAPEDELNFFTERTFSELQKSKRIDLGEYD